MRVGKLVSRTGHLFVWDVPEEPGTRSWHYAREAEGIIRQLTQRQYRGFFDGEAPWPGHACEERFVRLATVVVEMKDRVPGLILREFYTKHRVDDAGLLDVEHWNQGADTKGTVMWGSLGASNEDADRFATRRLHGLYGWQPTAVDVAAMVVLLRRRGITER